MTDKKPKEIEIGGQTYSLREPAIEDVQAVAEYANGRIAELLRGRKLDQSLDLSTALASILTEGNMFTRYLTSLQMNEPIMTVMLATGCSPDIAVKASMSALKTCRDYLGGGASDFLHGYGIDIRIKQAAEPEAVTQKKAP